MRAFLACAIYRNVYGKKSIFRRSDTFASASSSSPYSIVHIVLAAGFVYSGWMKTVRIESSKKTWAWVNDVPKRLVVLIGIAELLGALGLVLP
ncbi:MULTISPECIES: DoxX family protein [Paenibacillus]